MWLSLLMLLSVAQARPQVAVVVSDDLRPYEQPLDGFVEALGEPAAVYRLHGRRTDADRIVRHLENDRPAAIFCIGAKACYAAHQGLPSVPLVFAGVVEPARYGLAGRRITGVSTKVAPISYVSQFINFFPDVKTIGVIRGPSSSDSWMAALKQATDEVGVGLEVREVGTPRRVGAVFNELDGKIDALWLKPDRTILTRDTFRLLAEQTRRRRIPLLVETDNMVRAGGLFAVVPDPKAVGAQAAVLVQRVLDGTPTSELPVQDPEVVLTALNVRRLQSAQIPFDTLLLDFVDLLVE